MSARLHSSNGAHAGSAKLTVVAVVRAVSIGGQRASVVSALLLLVLTSCTSPNAWQHPQPVEASGDGRPGGAVVPQAAFMDHCSHVEEIGQPPEYCGNQTQVIERLAQRPLRHPRVGEVCPTSAGSYFAGHGFGGITLGGRHPVQPLVGPQAGEKLALHGRLVFGQHQGQWLDVKTLWFARATYAGPFLIRGTRLDAQGNVWFGENPIAPMLAVRASQGTKKVVRDIPGGTYVRAPGCYAWQVDGRGFSYSIVFEARLPQR